MNWFAVTGLLSTADWIDKGLGSMPVTSRRLFGGSRFSVCSLCLSEAVEDSLGELRPFRLYLVIDARDKDRLHGLPSPGSQSPMKEERLDSVSDCLENSFCDSGSLKLRGEGRKGPEATGTELLGGEEKKPSTGFGSWEPTRWSLSLSNSTLARAMGSEADVKIGRYLRSG